MRRIKLGMVMLCLLLVSGCGTDSVVVMIHVKNVTPDVSVLQVGGRLNGVDLGTSEYSQNLSALAVKLPAAKLGTGQLTLNLFGLAVDGCKLSAVRHDLQVSAATPWVEMDLGLALLPQKLCTLTIQKFGEGSVISSPAGVSCGTSCTMDVAIGTKVTLTATATTPFSGSLWDGCSAWNDSCEVTMTQAQKVGVQWGPEVRPKFVKIPKGSFTMGSPTGESGRGSNEVQHAVTLTTDFWMAESEVTQRQYRNLMAGNPSVFKGDDLPVENVSWFDAATYCNALSVKEKLQPCYQINGPTVGWEDGVKCTGYRLPTEAEWEYAANPASPPRTVYAGSDTIDGVAWYSTNSGSTTHAVMTKTANGRALYDLSGNVWEWVWDWYQGNYEALPPSDPIGPSTGANRVIRGGAWFNTAAYARVAQRSILAPTLRDYNVGFRIVRSYP